MPRCPPALVAVEQVREVRGGVKHAQHRPSQTSRLLMTCAGLNTDMRRWSQVSQNARMLPLADLRWPLTTERLSLRPATSDDAAAIWAYRRLPEVHEWLGLAPGDRATWDEAFAEPERLAKTVAVEAGGVMVGDLMIASRDGWGQREVADRAAATEAELGWTLHPAHTGRGYATEAVRAAIGLCFAPQADGGLGLRRVTASCFAANEMSWRLMERVGMRREQYGVRDSLHRDRGWLDGVTYALLAEEWSAMSERD